SSSTVRLSAETVVAGGAALARDPNGRVVFVTGALPGEEVDVRLTDVHRDFARAMVTSVVRASPDRTAPPCPYVPARCGGSAFQPIDPGAQTHLNRTIVLDALRRQAHLEDPRVEPAPALATTGFRTSVRCAVDGGRAGFRLGHGHDVLSVDGCLVAHPL